MNIPLNAVLALSGVIFVLGVLGVLIRRNAIVVFMSIELMLNAANLALISFSRTMSPADVALGGQVMVFFIIAAKGCILVTRISFKSISLPFLSIISMLLR